MNKCAKASKRIAKTLWKGISPEVMGFIRDMDGVISETDWTDETKRSVALELAKARAKLLGQRVKDNSIHAAISVVHQGSKMAADAAEESFDSMDFFSLGDTPDDDEVESL